MNDEDRIYFLELTNGMRFFVLCWVDEHYIWATARQATENVGLENLRSVNKAAVKSYLLPKLVMIFPRVNILYMVHCALEDWSFVFEEEALREDE